VANYSKRTATPEQKRMLSLSISGKPKPGKPTGFGLEVGIPVVILSADRKGLVGKKGEITSLSPSGVPTITLRNGTEIQGPECRWKRTDKEFKGQIVAATDDDLRWPETMLAHKNGAEI
jgi:hypothetical protein